MSKNVAVFVDVANIFYAAKAAGVDIDYVTLLKSATAGRDMVRAYAYTGLDPENENQRQFHSFLSRSGYKVVSKDIRKYGDGRIKANLDIELVVDMMRMATHLDIAVVISGDGDFAPAIRAVQQMGVRVEVISFRGNTSSDLIEVADVFVDITQVARVEKGARSGRRVAAEGDLSMTEVPDKETEGATRRRRTPRRAPEREVAAIVALPDVVSEEPDALPGNVIVLPGERLSRVAHVDEDLPAVSAPDSDMDTAEGAGTVVADGDMETDADGRRRRRRRGGRGRGRGRREDGQEGQPMTDGQSTGAERQTAGAERQSAAMERQAMIEPAHAQASGEAAEIPEDDEEFLDEVPVAIPQHSTFGSVWDTQLGVPAAPLTGTPLAEDEEDFDEPEIPEYLLAERRQQQQRNRGGRSAGGGGNRGGRGGGAYRTALDRERFGRSGVSSFGGGGAAAGGMGSNMSRPPDRQRGREQRPPAPNRQGRPPMRESVQRQPSRPMQQAPRPTPDAEPWSEVPAEVQALLRAELARRSGRPEASTERSASERAPGQAQASTESPESTASTAATPAAAEPQPGQNEPAAPTATPTRKRAPRTTSRARAASAAAPEADQAEAGAQEASAGTPAQAETAPVRPRATRARRTAPAESEPAPPATADGEPEAAQPAPKRRTTRKTSSAAAESSPTAEAAPPAEESPKPRRRATRKPSATGAAEGAGSGEGEGDGAPEA